MKKRNKSNSRFEFLFNKQILNSKRSQSIFGISFGTIFSVLLIVFFIVIAFIVINSFLKTQKCAQIGIFVDDFRGDVKDAWNSQSSSFESSGVVPSSLDYVCFANLSVDFKGKYLNIGEEIGIYQGVNANLFFSPRTNACNMPYHNIEHLDIGKITAINNPYCIMVDDGKVVIQLEKGFNDNLVGLN